MNRRVQRLVVAVATVIVLVGLFSVVVQFRVPPTGGQTRVGQVLYLLNPVVTAVLGGYLVTRRPRHPAGWLLLLISVAGVIDSLSKGVLNLKIGPGTRFSLRSWAAWLDNWVWVLMFAGIIFMILTFPTGALPSPRWRPAARVIGAVVALETIVCALVGVAIDSPGVVPISPAVVPEIVAGMGFLPVLACLGMAVVSLVVRRRRYRRAGNAVGVAQIRWLQFVAAIVAGSLAIGLVVDGTTKAGSPVAQAYDVLSQLVFYGFPLAIGVAVSRHGLFEIDRVISRTASYSAIVALLTVVYIAVVTSAARLVPDRFGSVPVAVATLAVVAVFVPLRRRAVHVIDRRFNRGRYDAERVVAAFADRMRVQEAVDPTGADLLVAVRTVLHPEHAGVWLAPSGRDAG